MRRYKMVISPENARFIMLSFEGPDQYCMAGGLGTRMTYLSSALAEIGFDVDFFFVGDPNLPSEEKFCADRLTYRRWCQWISKYHSAGVYDNENGKIDDFNSSVPYFVKDNIIKPAINSKKISVVMAEEWHTAYTTMILSDELHKDGIRNKAVILWNANNTMSFHKINWGRLGYVAEITTVSRFMKQQMWKWGVNPIVIPNSIPSHFLNPLPKALVNLTKNVLKQLGYEFYVLKIGRWDPAKRWKMAIESMASLKRKGVKVLFIVRGGKEPYGGEMLHLASTLGLNVYDLWTDDKSVEGCIKAMEKIPQGTDMVNLTFFLPDIFVYLLYNCCNCVLANSGFEPFGLVGLEVMAFGGLVFTGATGEDYLVPFVNGVSVETEDPEEIVSYIEFLNANPNIVKKIKDNARKTAEYFSCESVIVNLLRRIEYVVKKQGVSLK